MLERPGKLIKAVYFLENGFASGVADADKRPIEVGLIGREGMTGISVILGADRSDEDTYMQSPGHGYCLRNPSASSHRAERHLARLVAALRARFSQADHSNRCCQRAL